MREKRRVNKNLSLLVRFSTKRSIDAPDFSPSSLLKLRKKIYSLFEIRAGNYEFSFGFCVASEKFPERFQFNDEIYIYSIVV